MNHTLLIIAAIVILLFGASEYAEQTYADCLVAQDAATDADTVLADQTCDRLVYGE